MKDIVGCADYDSMGNHGRFPIPKDRDIKMKKKLQKIFLWVSYKFRKKSRKDIWDL